MKTIYDKLKKTDIGWRFINNDKVIFDEKSINDIIINSREKSKKEWKKITGSSEGHLFKLPNSFWRNLNKISCVNITWDDDNQRQCISSFIKEDDKILFFWGKYNSIFVSGGTFLKYWDDFCYPGDDNDMIIIYEKNLLITFVDDIFILYSLK
ncbi:DUF2947 family protein [Phocaeicola plebeius]|uniref:DUF2947 family protein n=1 Tax=Phocaeicola plebeius TaxID=310297 RepID=UPI0035656286